MRSRLIPFMCAAVAAGFHVQVQAQEAVGNVDERPDYQRLAAVYRAQIQQGETRIADLSRQMLTLDGQIEQNITNVLQLLTGVRDSPESGTRVAAAKKSATDALRRSIQFYANERRKRLSAESSSLGAVPQADLDAEAKALSARIDRRIDQIVEVTASLTQFDEWKSYERYQDDGDDGASDAERQQRRDVSTAEHQKGQLLGQMDEAVEKLKRENVVLNNRKDQLPATSPERAELDQRIATNNEHIRNLQEKRSDVLSPAGAATRGVSSRAAFEIDRMVDDLTRGVRNDTRQLVQLASRRNAERARVANLRDRLAQVDAALAAPKAPPAP